MSRARRGPSARWRPLFLPLLILALALLGAAAGYGLGSWWVADGTSSAGPIPAEMQPVVTSPALPPREATASEYEDVDLGVPLVQIPAPPPPRLPTAAVANELEHVVQPGESLSLIAASYGVSVEEIAAANNIADASVINVGQVLIIPGPR